jgi:ATP-dependent DNA helicase RecQ
VIAAVTGYAGVRTCRHAQIADYFGEEGVPRRCEACDNCLAAELPAAPPVGDEAVRAALAGAARFSGRIGMVNLAAILAGKDVKWTREQAWVRETPAFGTLSGWSDGRLRDLLQELLAAGCLGQTPGQYPLTTIAELGRDVLAGTARVEISLPGMELPSRTASGRAATAISDPDRFEKLRSWRTDMARSQGMPPYVIFHDRTLAELAGRSIANLADLAAVPGLGPAKLEKYGAQLLELLKG